MHTLIEARIHALDGAGDGERQVLVLVRHVVERAMHLHIGDLVPGERSDGLHGADLVGDHALDLGREFAADHAAAETPAGR